jgi:hypothetical protein
MSPGPDYSSDDEAVVGSVPASAPRMLNTAAGNERGSNPVYVERPPVV